MSTVDSDSNIGILIPAYNAEPFIGPVIQKFKSFGLPIIVINDGSTDHTLDKIQDLGITEIYSHEKNRGKGAALRTGFQKALEAGWDACITIDADGQHAATDIPKFLEAHLDYPHALLLGTRSLRKMPWATRIHTLLGTFFLSLRSRHFLTDTQCGYRLYPRLVLEQIHPRFDRYEMESEVLCIAGKKRIPIIKIPVETIYRPEISKRRHFRPWRDSWRIIFMFFLTFKSNELKKSS